MQVATPAVSAPFISWEDGMRAVWQSVCLGFLTWTTASGIRASSSQNHPRSVTVNSNPARSLLRSLPITPFSSS
ncbi:hypothetical protein G7K_5413-t1 [Saitoella complicata NRRL Y-17804]|uniref:Uncharacterized protein n=1 Tax=Saitoella complicata (strain BCRC 22490 / CBS 7301 / JCM 7358 / NBRC 10748 / NRRL Y-17804) TaxID=698492 RepID=A0A0E9NNB6_SAICN|nr:hypothetical protein G7K_5413-t1 [Saitoella complicata NRRL Y-17804]